MSQRRVLVTGATRGIGAALVEKFLAAGDRVFGCGRSSGAPTAAGYRHFEVDVADASAVRDMFRAIRSDAGGLDVLVNNAGIARMNVVALTPPDDARKVLDTGILPVINTGIAHKQAGVGQIGAGVTAAPLACFIQAVCALDARVKEHA